MSLITLDKNLIYVNCSPTSMFIEDNKINRNLIERKCMEDGYNEIFSFSKLDGVDFLKETKITKNKYDRRFFQTAIISLPIFNGNGEIISDWHFETVENKEAIEIDDKKPYIIRSSCLEPRYEVIDFIKKIKKGEFIYGEFATCLCSTLKEVLKILDCDTDFVYCCEMATLANYSDYLLKGIKHKTFKQNSLDYQNILNGIDKKIDLLFFDFSHQKKHDKKFIENLPNICKYAFVDDYEKEVEEVCSEKLAAYEILNIGHTISGNKFAIYKFV